MSRLDRLSAAPDLDPVLAVAQQVAPPTPPAVTKPAPQKKEKLGAIYGYPEELDELRGAWWHSRHLEGGFESFSDFIKAGVLLYKQQMEERHNGGRPFPSVAANKVTRSRRTG